MFFDSARDGYDGRFGHGSSYDQSVDSVDVTCPDCGGAELKVLGELIYNIDAEELEEALGPESSDKFSDYFDAIDVNVECASCRRGFNVGNWELA